MATMSKLICSCIPFANHHKNGESTTTNDAESLSGHNDSQSPWADGTLPNDIMLVILGCLSPWGDFVRFGCVCRLWRSVAVKQNYRPFRQMPWLMACERYPSTDSNISRIYSPSEDKVYDLELPEARNASLCGSSRGWLAMQSRDTREVFLLNPVSRVRCHLPPLAKPKKGNSKVFIDKIVLSDMPSDNDCIALAIYRCSSDRYKLAFVRPSEKRWTPIGTGMAYTYFFDAMYHRGHGRFYAIEFDGSIVRCDIRRRDPRVDRLFPSSPSPEVGSYSTRYLVESPEGGLLQVLKYWYHPFETAQEEERNTHFRIFRMDMSIGRWITVKDLGDQSIFLGWNCCVSVAASDFAGCRRSCIYFAMHPSSSMGNYDMGVFSLSEGRTIEKRYKENFISQTCYAPMWITPNPGFKELRLEMAGTMFTHSLERMKNVKSEQGEMLTKPFLDVCKLILPVIDKFGAAMALVKSDIRGNITRLENKYSSDPSKYEHLYNMVQEEVDAKTAKASSSYTIGLLWLTRAMDFLVELFRNLLDHPDWTMSQAFSDSYEKTLKKWHGWLASSNFSFNALNFF